MKKIFLTISFIFLTAMTVAAKPADDISKIENEIFGMEYKTETETARLDRLENSVYGKATTLPVKERIEKLNADLGIYNEKTAEKTKYVPKADSTVSYPIVDKMEKQVFGKTYEKEDIYKRVERLEMKVFNKKYDDDLNSQVSRLSAAVLKTDIINNPQYESASTPQYQYQYQAMDTPCEGCPAQPTYTYNPSDVYLQLSALEQAALKKNYSSEDNSARLSRLENKIFGRDFSQDMEITRLERLSAAQTAKKTAKYYDAYRTQKYVSTGLQIGTLILMILAFIL